MLIAVETGDVVASTKLNSQHFTAAIHTLKKSLGNITDQQHGKFEMFRGDAYQIVYSAPQYALKYALLTKLVLLSHLPIKVHLSQSIAIDFIDSEIEHPSECLHSVLVNSGRALDNGLKGEIILTSDVVAADFLLLTRFLNRLINALTQKQAEALYWYIKLDYPEQIHIAEKLNMTRQNVNAHLNRGNADLVKAVLLQFESNMDKILSNKNDTFDKSCLRSE